MMNDEHIKGGRNGPIATLYKTSTSAFVSRGGERNGGGETAAAAPGESRYEFPHAERAPQHVPRLCSLPPFSVL